MVFFCAWSKRRASERNILTVQDRYLSSGLVFPANASIHFLYNFSTPFVTFIEVEQKEKIRAETDSHKSRLYIRLDAMTNSRGEIEKKIRLCFLTLK